MVAAKTGTATVGRDDQRDGNGAGDVPTGVTARLEPVVELHLHFGIEEPLVGFVAEREDAGNAKVATIGTIAMFVPAETLTTSKR